MRRFVFQAVGVCSLSVFLLMPLLLSAQEKSAEKSKAESKIPLPDGSLEELRDFVVKYYEMTERLVKSGQLQADQTAPAEAVRDACDKILADPTISDTFRLWTLKKRAYAQVMLTYADPTRYFGKLVAAVDDYEQWDGCENIVKLVETQILRIGMRIVTMPKDINDPKPLKLDFNALVDRLLFFLETYREQESTLLVRQMIDAVKATPPIQRDRMMLVIAERLSPFYLKSKDPVDVAFGRDLQGTARLFSLPGKPMLLEGVLPSGESFNPETLKGKVVLVQFWEPSCVHCRAEMLQFVEFLEQYGKKGFEVVGVCTQGGTKAVQDFLRKTVFPGEKRITWPILVDELAPKKELPRLADYYSIRETPVLVLIGRDGNVVRVNPLPNALPLEIEQALYPKAPDDGKETLDPSKEE